ncbi:MAG: M56 family metallopeptidase [Acetatifactor sp.]|nr:M56 family metallopeptidase [Acetatifactor sp.]
MQILNFCAYYYTLQLVRCVMVSFAVFAVVIILRKTILKDKVFLKGALWVLFIPVLSAGRMKFFDESSIGRMLSAWWKMITINHVWICWLYLGVAFVYAILLYRKRRKLKKQVASMEKRELEGTIIYVTGIPVTPSTIGVLRPKIVMPEVILKEYDGKEIQTILLHEKTHIRLGHLLFYFLWDVLRVLLWLNPLLTIGVRFFREDLEEICDWVTIRGSRGTAYTYGQMLLKSMRILQAESEDFNMSPTFAGDKEYRNIRQRMTQIAGYKPYKRMTAIVVMVVAMLFAAGAIVWIHNLSYDKNIEMEDIVLTYGYENGNVTFMDCSDELCRMISYDNLEDNWYIKLYKML